jgi:hypothetical protein
MCAIRPSSLNESRPSAVCLSAVFPIRCTSAVRCAVAVCWTQISDNVISGISTRSTQRGSELDVNHLSVFRSLCYWDGTLAGRAPQRRDAAYKARGIEPAVARGALDLGSAVSRNEQLQRHRGGLDRGPEKCDRDRASTTRRLQNVEPRLTSRTPGLCRLESLRCMPILVNHVKRPAGCN